VQLAQHLGIQRVGLRGELLGARVGGLVGDQRRVSTIWITSASSSMVIGWRGSKLTVNWEAALWTMRMPLENC
jgi:hypothetical protein